MAAGGLPAAGSAEPNPFSFHEFVRSKARSGEEAGDARQIRRRLERRRTRRRMRMMMNGAGATGPWPWSRPTSPPRAPPRPPPAPSSARARGWRAASTRAWPPSEPLRDRASTPCGSLATRRMRKLERKLEENKIKEEKEAQDLEAMVQHVEQNLQLMTKRAVKAENNATKLKQENALLQVQLKNYKTENEALRSGQSASLAAVKQNADLALQNLLTVITNSRSSIKQLVSGAESLQLVADLLRSVDRIAEVPEDGQ
ncbi:endosome-associated-trafficking regulator 1 isoform 2-T2 [Alca torda]